MVNAEEGCTRIERDAIKGQFSGDFKHIDYNSRLAEEMLDKKVGDKVEFGEGYRVVIVE